MNLTRKQIIERALRLGLTGTNALACLFRVSDQTIRNWEHDDEPAPDYLFLCLSGLEAWKEAGLPLPPRLPDPDLAWLESWMIRNNVGSFAALARVLGVRRQSVSRWVSKLEFPDWLPLACLGFEAISGADKVNA